MKIKTSVEVDIENFYDEIDNSIRDYVQNELKEYVKRKVRKEISEDPRFHALIENYKVAAFAALAQTLGAGD